MNHSVQIQAKVRPLPVFQEAKNARVCSGMCAQANTALSYASIGRGLRTSLVADTTYCVGAAKLKRIIDNSMYKSYIDLFLIYFFLLLFVIVETEQPLLALRGT